MQRFPRYVLLIGMGALLTLAWRAEAQPGRSRGGYAPVYSAGPNRGAVRPVVAGPALPVTGGYNYGGSPRYGSGAPIGSAGIPYVPVVTNIYNNYYMPVYTPAVRGRAGPLDYDLPWWYFAASDPYLVAHSRNMKPRSKEATVEILMPRSDADLFVDGTMMTTGGLRRFFTSPELEPGKYTYNVTARWMEDGQEVRVDRTVEVSPGGRFFLDFNRLQIELGAAARD